MGSSRHARLRKPWRYGKRKNVNGRAALWSPTAKPVAPFSTLVGRNPERKPPTDAGARVEGSQRNPSWVKLYRASGNGGVTMVLKYSRLFGGALIWSALFGVFRAFSNGARAGRNRGGSCGRKTFGARGSSVGRDLQSLLPYHPRRTIIHPPYLAVGRRIQTRQG